jgi:NADPH:quinone reductase-like Zn-dependent oxidoreductase
VKAIRIHEYGGPEVFVYEDAPRPEPAAGEVLVKVHATALNPVDRFTRAGYLQGMANFTLPFIPGLDLAGVVEAVGEGVTTVAAGDAVYGYSNMMRQGAYAEYAVVSAGEIAPKPASLDFETAASVPLVGLTAWQGLFGVGGLQAGQTVLIHGAGGGVGSLAVQFARAKGAQVLATAGSDKLALLRDLGVAAAIDYTTTRFIVDPVVKTRIWVKISGSRSFPVQKILDTVGRRRGCLGTPNPARRELSTAHWHGSQ